MKLPISKISELTGIHRDTLSKRLARFEEIVASLMPKSTDKTHVPYITHLLGVASLVLGDVSDPDL